MNPIICQAIKDMRVLTFQYDGHFRKIEPHAYGITTADNEAIRCYQTSGGSNSGTVPGWHLMLVGRISSLVVTEETFSSARPGYRRGDRGMSTIFYEL